MQGGPDRINRERKVGSSHEMIKQILMIKALLTKPSTETTNKKCLLVRGAELDKRTNA